MLTDYELLMMALGADSSEVPLAWESLILADDALLIRWEQACKRARKEELKTKLLFDYPFIAEFLYGVKKSLMHAGRFLQLWTRPIENMEPVTLGPGVANDSPTKYGNVYDDWFLELDLEETVEVSAIAAESQKTIKARWKCSEDSGQFDSDSSSYEVGRFKIFWKLEANEAPILIEFYEEGEDEEKLLGYVVIVESVS